MGKEKLHILALPFPVQGHINPMLQFYKGLKLSLDMTLDIPYDQSIQAQTIGVERVSFPKEEGSWDILGHFQDLHIQFHQLVIKMCFAVRTYVCVE